LPRICASGRVCGRSAGSNAAASSAARKAARWSTRSPACRTASGHAPQLLAALCNTALTIRRRLGLRPVEGFEHFAENRTQLLNILTQRKTE
jgi:hypothetical protein